ncbi:MAG TPA: PqqD family protein [Acidobacteriota bacterium]|jgi:hypothetical protein|nr:PqqD family protein [Acidobacteriota bacterium]
MTQPANLLDLRPRRKRDWELTEQGLAVILVPRFERGLLARWLMPRLTNPYIRVRLDSFGSFVWEHCDGETSVGEIADRLRLRFGPSIEPAYDRIVAFVRRLKREGLISL